MPPWDVLQALRRRPFEPFRLVVSDGTSYTVNHPDLVAVTLGSLILDSPPSTPWSEVEELRSAVGTKPLHAGPRAPTWLPIRFQGSVEPSRLGAVARR